MSACKLGLCLTCRPFHVLLPLGGLWSNFGTAQALLRLPVGGFLILVRTPMRFRGLDSGLELPGVLLPEDALERLLLSRIMEPALGVLSPDEEVALLEGDALKGLGGPILVLRKPVSILSVSTQDLS